MACIYNVRRVDQNAKPAAPRRKSSLSLLMKDDFSGASIRSAGQQRARLMF